MVTNLHAMAFAANANRNNKFEHAKTRALFVTSPLNVRERVANETLRWHDLGVLDGSTLSASFFLRSS
ncbi:hypothetical protein CCP3SC1AL1_1170002 [Gammaproteobacteria bacterium]